MSRWTSWWPGEGGSGSVPPGFPGEPPAASVPPSGRSSTGTVERRNQRRKERRPRRERTWRRPPVTWPGLARTSVPTGFPDDEGPTEILRDEAAATGAVEAEPRPARTKAKAPRRPCRGFGAAKRVVAAVYAALADPIVGGDEAARELRALRVRRLGVLTASAVLVVVMVYVIFPVRTYLDQRAATRQAEERIEKIGEANERLAERAEELREPEEVEEIARRDHGMVFPGEESYGVLPPPAGTTTTTTAPPP